MTTRNEQGILGQRSIGVAHHHSETIDVTTGDTARVREIAKTEGENGAGLEIAATVTDGTGEMDEGLETAKGVRVGTVATIDEVRASASYMPRG